MIVSKLSTTSSPVLFYKTPNGLWSELKYSVFVQGIVRVRYILILTARNF